MYYNYVHQLSACTCIVFHGALFNYGSWLSAPFNASVSKIKSNNVHL